ncbi:tyrosine-type recombinase/integrase [Agrococcus jejuensis]|uniref:Site-specific recombinase XerC n=1 Tax=Agrococcus jejuensis TaxID=399736 RepID=A0A1G8EZL6_9MICO|nr:site-specific integrase [Agrococcus jejuensis]SDH75312.1 Site-specific recombinase XerC [Agrococcus jejuensis]
MARPRTPIGTYGAISAVEVAPKRWRARTRFRFDDGSLRQLERFATSKAKARAALLQAVATIAESTTADLTRTTTLDELADRFLASKVNLAPRSIDTYRQTIDHHVRPRVGRVSVGEATVDRLQRFLLSVQAESGPGAAKACKSVLSGMLGLAVRSGSLRTNPVRDLEAIARPERGGAEAIPLADLPVLVERVIADERLRQLDVADLIVFLAGTGARVSEACGLDWRDVDLAAGTVTIRANVVRARGQGLIRQEHTKTKAGQRTITLPQSLAGRLGDRRIRGTLHGSSLVFPTVLGNLRDPRNTSRDWAEARDRLGFPTVTTHSFRKTVATALDRAGLSARDIAEYLGHEQPSMTQDVYMAKRSDSTRAAAALGEALSPK